MFFFFWQQELESQLNISAWSGHLHNDPTWPYQIFQSRINDIAFASALLTVVQCFTSCLSYALTSPIERREKTIPNKTARLAKMPLHIEIVLWSARDMLAYGFLNLNRSKPRNQYLKANQFVVRIFQFTVCTHTRSFVRSIQSFGFFFSASSVYSFSPCP